MGTQPVGCGLSRRSVFGAAGALGAAFVLAACEGSPAAPATSAPAPAGASTPTPAGPPGALVALEQVPVGTGVIAPGPVLVTRASADEIRAYDAVCPHQRITIGTPDPSGTITCPGHGARFAAADGKLLSGPAPTGLKAIAVDVQDQDGFVVRA
jgi:nitrite reductase/ring-hydroxylating ferredoxin subunit